MKNILVPTDFSTEAKIALDLAIQIAKKTDATIHLLHVIEFPSGSLSIIGDVYAGSDAMDQIYSIRLREVIDGEMKTQVDYVNSHEVAVTGKVTYGNVYRHIESMTSETDTAMIIMGTKGSSGWHEVLVGSNAEKVIRRSQVPVLTVKKPLKLEQINNILFAIGKPNDKAVSFIQQFQELTDSTCHLLKVYRPTAVYYTADQANKEIDDFAKEAGFTNFTTNLIEAPWVDEGILEFVKRKPFDLIAMGTHGYRGISHFLLGSNAEDVANHADLPVLSIKVE